MTLTGRDVFPFQRQRMRALRETERKDWEKKTMRKKTQCLGNSVCISSLISTNYSLKTLFTDFPLVVWVCSVKDKGTQLERPGYSGKSTLAAPSLRSTGSSTVFGQEGMNGWVYVV